MSFKNFKKGDEVRVISGDDRGKAGKILRLQKDRDRVIVEKINIVKKHQKAGRSVQAGIIEKPAPIHISNIMLICPKCKEDVKVRRDVVADQRVRICKECEEVIDKVK
jgi:large subunit ribosomal protein L24